MKNRKILLYSFLFTFILYGCSANLKNTVSLSTLTVETPNCGNATCRIKTEFSVYYIDTPGTISLKASDKGFDVVCYVEAGTPENLVVNSKVDFVSHPLSCPETKEEIVLKEKYLEKVEIEKESTCKQDTCVNCDPEICVEDQALKAQAGPLKSEEDLALLEQLKDLFEQGLISKIVYEKEKALINNKIKE